MGENNGLVSKSLFCSQLLSPRLNGKVYCPVLESPFQGKADKTKQFQKQTTNMFLFVCYSHNENNLVSILAWWGAKNLILACHFGGWIIVLSYMGASTQEIPSLSYKKKKKIGLFAWHLRNLRRWIPMKLNNFWTWSRAACFQQDTQN